MTGHLDPDSIGSVIELYDHLLVISGKLGLRTVDERRAWARAAAVWLLTDPDCPLRAVPA